MLGCTWCQLSLSLVTYVEKLLIFSAWVEAVQFCLWTDEFCHYSSSPPEPAGGNWKWVLFSASLVSSFAPQNTNVHTYIVLRAWNECSPSKYLRTGILNKGSLVILWRHHLVIRGSGEKRGIRKMTFFNQTVEFNVKKTTKIISKSFPFYTRTF